MKEKLNQRCFVFSQPMGRSFDSPEWARNTNIYEVNLRQYTGDGTIQAFAQHLPRLKDMGVDTLWFMPIHPIGEKNRKGSLGSYYSIRDYTDVHPGYGTVHDFSEFVRRSHAMGFKIMMDWVANHTSWDHVWTKTAPDFFVRDEHGNFHPPYAEWSDVIKLDYENAAMRQAMIDAMKFWVRECDIDGYRCDMAHLVPLEFWQDARQQVDSVKKLFWLAETEDPNYHSVFDASYTWEFLHMMEKFWRRETDTGDLDWVLNKYSENFPKEALRIFFTSNHDENSHSGSEYYRMGDAARAFAVLCATWSGIPLIYGGQELPNYKSLAFFEKDVIEWSERIELHDFYKILLNLKKTNPAMMVCDQQASTQRIKTSADHKIFSFLRQNSGDEVLVALNLSPDQVAFSIGENISGNFREVFTGEQKQVSPNGNLFELSPWQWLVLEKMNTEPV